MSFPITSVRCPLLNQISLAASIFLAGTAFGVVTIIRFAGSCEFAIRFPFLTRSTILAATTCTLYGTTFRTRLINNSSILSPKLTFLRHCSPQNTSAYKQKPQWEHYISLWLSWLTNFGAIKRCRGWESHPPPQLFQSCALLMSYLGMSKKTIAG